jgi:hypothetical protein
MMVKSCLVILVLRNRSSLWCLVVKVRILCRNKLTSLLWVLIGLLTVLSHSLVSVVYPRLSVLLGRRVRVASILLVHVFIERGVAGLIRLVAIQIVQLSGIVLLLLLVSDGSNAFEDGQSTNNVFVDQVELVEEGVLGADQSLHQAVDVFLEDLLVADVLFQVSILLLDLHQICKGQGVDELASLSVRALEVLMVLLAELGLVSGWDMLLLLKFVVTMSESTSVSVLAFLVLDPTFAEFCLNL